VADGEGDKAAEVASFAKLTITYALARLLTLVIYDGYAVEEDKVRC
jgi:hypothetical protein